MPDTLFLDTRARYRIGSSIFNLSESSIGTSGRIQIDIDPSSAPMFESVKELKFAHILSSSVKLGDADYVSLIGEVTLPTGL